MLQVKETPWHILRWLSADIASRFRGSTDDVDFIRRYVLGEVEGEDLALRRSRYEDSTTVPSYTWRCALCQMDPKQSLEICRKKAADQRTINFTNDAIKGDDAGIV